MTLIAVPSELNRWPANFVRELPTRPPVLSRGPPLALPDLESADSL